MVHQEPPRLLVIDDEESIRRALTAALRGAGYEVRAEASGLAIEDAALAFEPHLAILDVRLPEGPNGYELARLLRLRNELPIIFLSAADGLSDRLEGFVAGADDYLVKPFALSELLARVSALLRRSGRMPAPPRQLGDLVIDEAARTAVRCGTSLELTTKEFDLLFALARSEGHVVPKSKLLRSVWRYESYDENLVEVHICSLRRKLEALGPRVIHTVRGAGYVLRP